MTMIVCLSNIILDKLNGSHFVSTRGTTNNITPQILSNAHNCQIFFRNLSLAPTCGSLTN
jgi:hypothetical protein